MFVLDGFTADLIVVVARTAGTSGTDGISFFTVRGDADGLTRTALSTMDMTRKQAKLEFNNVVASPLGSTVGGFLRVLGGGRGQRGASRGGRALEGVLLGGVLPRDRREHSDPRRHRLYVGAHAATVLQARQVCGDLPRRP